MAELFGTDGARGRYRPDLGHGYINAQTVEGLAHASATLARDEIGGQPTFVLGRDTRPSGPSLEAAAIRGVVRAGGKVLRMGVAPTPAIAWAAQNMGVFGIDLTASHNGAEDNGYKLFCEGGIKPDEAAVEEVERRYKEYKTMGPQPYGRNGSVHQAPHLVDHYLESLARRLGGDDAPLDGKLVVIDGANGAGFELAPRLFGRLGAKAVPYACDLKNPINKDSGAAHLYATRNESNPQSGLRRFLRDNPELVQDHRFIGAYAGDGDFDRVMAVTRNGDIVDGNHWMHTLAEGEQGIVGTLYTNTGMRRALAEVRNNRGTKGVEFHECRNGDSYVTQKLRELGLRRGGEFTGHLIDLDHISSGDGIYMAGWMAVELARRGVTLEDLHASLPLWREVMVNVELKQGSNAKAIEKSEPVQAMRAHIKEEHGHHARDVVRASGTEPLIRAWVESTELGLAKHLVGQLVTVIEAQQ